MQISLVCTVKNEAENIAALLDSMLAQRRMPDEIVVNDCGSTDATPTIVRRYAERDARIRLVSGGHNIPSGRNSAVAAAHFPIVACTDAGLTLDPSWLEAIVAPLESGEADLVGGFFKPEPQSLWELALGATNYRNADEVDAARFLPFGKSMAFRKDAWRAVDGFPEWASHCEDLLFDLAIERTGFRRTFAPGAVVHFRPRPTPAAFARQYFLYARGDGRAGLWAKRYAARYAAYGVGGLLLREVLRKPQRHRGTQSTAGVVWPYVAAALLLVGAAAYTRGPYRRLWPQVRHFSVARRAYALALVPLIRVIGDVAKMAGYPAGLIRRRKA